MKFQKHPQLEGMHALLGASNYHWLNYSDEKLDAKFFAFEAAARGTRLHDLAKKLITEKVYLPTKPQSTLGLYVNDAIGFRMTPEVTLVYSNNAFGTADAIAFRDMKLRIFDFKSGTSRTSLKQLMVYAGLFCLEYEQSPFDIEFDLRIYQDNEVQEHETNPEDVLWVMDRIVMCDKRMEARKQEAQA